MSGKSPEEMHETRVEAGKSELGTSGGGGGGGREGRRGRRGARGESEKGKAKERGRSVIAAVVVDDVFFLKLTFFTSTLKPSKTYNRGRRHQGGEIWRSPRYWRWLVFTF